MAVKVYEVKKITFGELFKPSKCGPCHALLWETLALDVAKFVLLRRSKRSCHIKMFTLVVHIKLDFKSTYKKLILGHWQNFQSLHMVLYVETTVSCLCVPRFKVTGFV